MTEELSINSPGPLCLMGYGAVYDYDGRRKVRAMFANRVSVSVRDARWYERLWLLVTRRPVPTVYRPDDAPLPWWAPTPDVVEVNDWVN